MKGICGGFLVAAIAFWAAPTMAQDNPELGDVSVDDAPDASWSGAQAATAPSGGDVASDGIDYTGSLRLGLDTVLLSFVNTTFTLDADEDVEFDNSDLNLGIVASDLGLNVGYAFLDQLVLGARLQLSTSSGTETRPAGEFDTSRFAWLLQPYGEYVFTPGETLELLVSGSLGLRSVSAETDGSELSSFSFLMAVGGGAHVVLSPWASLDPILEVGYLLGSYSQGADDYSQSALFVSLRLGVSIWL